MLERLFVRTIETDRQLEKDGSYLAALPVIKNLMKMESLRLEKPVTIFAGENGTGKSTLLEAIAVCMGFNAEGGSRNFCFSTRSTESRLHEYLRIAKEAYPRDGFFLRAESFYNVASNIEDLDSQPAAAPYIIDAYGGESLHHQSHGESFMSLVLNRFRGNGLYILDEPEAALSPSRQLALIAELHRLVESDSQFIIATHSPLIMAYPGADIYVLSDEGVTLTKYKDTEHYQLTKRFLDNPERILNILFDKKDYQKGGQDEAQAD